MTFLRKIRRPYIVILAGVFLIGLGLLRGFLQGDFRAVESRVVSDSILPTLDLGDIIRTPIANSSGGGIEPTKAGGQEVEFLSANPNPEVHSQGKRAVLGSEPRMALLFEQINAAGKEFPVWMVIPGVDLSAPVVQATQRKVIMDGKMVDMWFAPDFYAVGWHTSMALPGEVGNLVFSGHNNDFGEVFSRLIDLNAGDTIQIITQKRVLTYRVSNKVLFQEVEIDLNQRMQNARWISPSQDERVTLVTCWPNDSNTHRLIIVASPE